LRELPSGWKEGFEGISQTGQPVAPDLPAADLLVPRSAFPADGHDQVVNLIHQIVDHHVPATGAAGS
jgi:hypothetical protein